MFAAQQDCAVMVSYYETNAYSYTCHVIGIISYDTMNMIHMTLAYDGKLKLLLFWEPVVA